MDTRTLEIGDAFDQVAPGGIFGPTTQKLVVVEKIEDRLGFVKAQAPLRVTWALAADDGLQIINSTRIQVADIHRGEGLEVVERYRKYESLVAEASEHSMEELTLDLAAETHKDLIEQAVALVSDLRLPGLSATAYGILVAAGVEPDQRSIVVVGALLAALARTSKGLGVEDLLGILGGGQ